MLVLYYQTALTGRISIITKCNTSTAITTTTTITTPVNSRSGEMAFRPSCTYDRL